MEHTPRPQVIPTKAKSHPILIFVIITLIIVAKIIHSPLHPELVEIVLSPFQSLGLNVLTTINNTEYLIPPKAANLFGNIILVTIAFLITLLTSIILAKLIATIRKPTRETWNILAKIGLVILVPIVLTGGLLLIPLMYIPLMPYELLEIPVLTNDSSFLPGANLLGIIIILATYFITLYPLAIFIEGRDKNKPTP